MARRMFSSDIVCSDEFLSMPVSSRELYFQLAMKADDDGFIQPKIIMRISGASDDDLKVLTAKRFILGFENGVIVIKHWLIHNMIRGDRYRPTRFQEEKNILKIKENKAYTEMAPKWCQSGAEVAPQVRLGKVRLGKVNTVTESDTPYSLKEEIKKLEDNERRDLNIIALYFDYRKPDLQNREQYQLALHRHLKPAKKLVSFSDEQILKAIKIAEKEYKDIYTLETLAKILTK